jgi:hypothetical protein
MANTEVNALLLRAVSDAQLRSKLMADPGAAAKEAGLSEVAVKELASMDKVKLDAQLSRLVSVVRDMGGPLEAGHSNDWRDKNIHNKDDHIHDKVHTAETGMEAVINPAVDAATLSAALKDPVVLKEFQNNEKLRGLAKKVLGKDI